MSNGDYGSSEPRARLCHLRRWPDYDGYGFNLHCEKSKPGQYIGKVDPDSPAESAGLRENDRIIEVNYVNIGNENHKQVVSRIKEGVSRDNTKFPEEVILLVLDREADDFYRNRNKIVRSSDANVEKRVTEVRGALPPPSSVENGDKTSSAHEWSSYAAPKPSHDHQASPSAKRDSHTQQQQQAYKNNADFTGPTVTRTQRNSSPPSSRNASDDEDDDAAAHPHQVQHSPSPPPRLAQNKQASSSPVSSSSPPSSQRGGDEEPYSPPRKDKQPIASAAVIHSGANEIGKASPLVQPNNNNNMRRAPVANGQSAAAMPVLEMSAAEYRAQLLAKNPKRQKDPRQQSHMSMKEKHEVIDRM